MTADSMPASADLANADPTSATQSNTNQARPPILAALSYLRATGFFSVFPIWAVLLAFQVFLSGVELDALGPVSFGSPLPLEFLSAVLIAATACLSNRWVSPPVFVRSWRVTVVRAGSLLGSLAISLALLAAPMLFSGNALFLASTRNFLLTLALCALFCVAFGRTYSWIAAVGFFSLPMLAPYSDHPLSPFALTLGREVAAEQWVLACALAIPSLVLWVWDPFSREVLELGRGDRSASKVRHGGTAPAQSAVTHSHSTSTRENGPSNSPTSTTRAKAAAPKHTPNPAFLFAFYARNSNLVFALILFAAMHVSWVAVSPKLWISDELATLSAITGPLLFSGPVLTALIAIDTARFVQGHRFLAFSPWRGPHRDATLVYWVSAVAVYAVLVLGIFLVQPPVHFSPITLLAVLTNVLFIGLFCVVGAVAGAQLSPIFAGLVGVVAGYFLTLQASIPVNDRFSPFDFDLGADYFAGLVLSPAFLVGQAIVLGALLVGLWLFPVVREADVRALFSRSTAKRTLALPLALAVFVAASVVLPVERTPNDSHPPTACSPLLRGELCIYPEMERVRPVLSAKINAQLAGLVESPFAPLLPAQYWLNWRAETPAGVKAYFLQSHEEDPAQPPFTYSLQDSVLWASCSAFQQHPDVRSGAFLEDPDIARQFQLATSAFDYYALSRIDSDDARAQLSLMDEPNLVLADVEPLLNIIGSCASD